jgi:hypothetical protein
MSNGRAGGQRIEEVAGMDAVVRRNRRQRRRTLLQRLDVITERRAQAQRRMPSALSGDSHGPGSDHLARPLRDEAT